MASPSLPQPPPYAEEESSPNIESQKHFRVNRKPVPGLLKVHVAAGDGEGISNNFHSEDAVYADDHKPPLPTRPELSVETTVTPRLESFASASTSTDLSSIRSVPVSNISSTTSPASSKSSASLHIQNAYREARHFAGGLITHPFESTKHFTILRHSHGLVFYKGSSTSLAISIFADAPLPPDRTLWLQSKGWTGKTGMRAKALIGRNGSWLNVTPTIEVTTEQLDPSDERAWQRDITSFRKKAQSKIRENHALRETAVVRIPVEADDGYFQIVLCMGDKKKVLCPSPVFRILSTSRSPSSIRGASLKSLPLELGALALGTYASNTVGRVISPVTSTVQSSVEQYMPSWKTRQAAMAAYDMSGVEDKVNTTLNDANGQYDQALQQSFTTASGDKIILEQGPEMPYPIRFFGRGQITHSTEVDQSSLPACTLSGVESNVLHRFYGHYFGWARRFEKSGTKTIDYPWHQVAISVLPLDLSQLTHVNVALTSKRTVTIRLITEETNMELDQIQLEILVMGFIRTDDPKQRANLTRGLQAGDEAAAEAAILSEVQDVSIVQSYLDHPSWSPQAISRPNGQAEKTNALEKAKMTYANTRIAAQNRIDRIPLHKLGIRAPTDSMRDKMVITNGFFVPRGKQFNDSIMS